MRKSKEAPILILYDFVWAGNCNLINIKIFTLFPAGNCNLMNIKVFTLFLPGGVHSECEVLPLNCFWWIGISLALSQLDCTTLPKKHQHTCSKSKGRHGPFLLSLFVTVKKPKKFKAKFLEQSSTIPYELSIPY